MFKTYYSEIIYIILEHENNMWHNSENLKLLALLNNF